MISLDFSLQVAGVLLILWIGQRLLDAIASFVIDRKVLHPIYQRILRRIKILRTNANQVATTFSLSFTPEERITIASAVEKLETGFKQAEQASKGKMSVKSQHWSPNEREGRVDIHYSNNAAENFTISVNITPDVKSVKKSGTTNPEEVLVGSIGMEIDFNFPFKLLEHTLFNLGTVVNHLERGLNDQMRGNFSDGRLIISPVESGLTVDEWIEEEKFDISLLLTSEEEGQAEVEFFPDRAEIKSTEREIDGQTVRYTKELLLNYYL